MYRSDTDHDTDLTRWSTLADASIPWGYYSLLTKSIDIYFFLRSQYFCRTGIYQFHLHIVSESNEGTSMIFLPVVPYCGFVCWVPVDAISVFCISHCFVLYHLRLLSIVTWVTDCKFHNIAVIHLNTTDEVYCVLFLFILNSLKLLIFEHAQSKLLHFYLQGVAIGFVINILYFNDNFQRTFFLHLNLQRFVNLNLGQDNEISTVFHVFSVISLTHQP